MTARSFLAAAFVALAAFGGVACAPDPTPSGPPDPIAVGDCYKNVPAVLSFRYIGPENAFHDTESFASLDCSSAPLGPATVVFAANASVALEVCKATNTGFTSVVNLSTTGWVSSDLGLPISDQVWGCSPAL